LSSAGATITRIFGDLAKKSAAAHRVDKPHQEKQIHRRLCSSADVGWWVVPGRSRRPRGSLVELHK
jgi:hypothetical protein